MIHADFHCSLYAQLGLRLQLLECLAIITFVGGNEPDKTEQSMQIMWQLVNSKLGANVRIFCFIMRSGVDFLNLLIPAMLIVAILFILGSLSTHASVCVFPPSLFYYSLITDDVLALQVVAAKPSAAVVTAMVSAWSFLLTKLDGWTLDPKNWQQ